MTQTLAQSGIQHHPYTESIELWVMAQLTAVTHTLCYRESWQRALQWWSAVTHLAAPSTLPLALIADIGALMTDSTALARLQSPHTQMATETESISAYRRFLQRVAQLPAMHEARLCGLHDGALIALLAYLATHAPTPACYRLPQGTSAHDAVAVLAPLLPTPPTAAPLPHGAATDSTITVLFTHIVEQLAHLAPNDIRFVQTIGANLPDAAELADIHALTDMLTLDPLDHIIVDEVLALLPALAEQTTPSHHMQTYAIDGIGGVATRGSLDMILPTEWAMSPAIQTYRYLNNTMLYYGRERPPLYERTLQLFLVQGGDAMAGDPDVLARASVLALVQRNATHIPHHITQRCCWFDSTLHPPTPLNRPRDIAAFLQHTSTGQADIVRVLIAVQAYVREQYNNFDRIAVQWIMHAHSGSDQHNAIEPLARWLRAHAACQAIFVAAGDGNDSNSDNDSFTEPPLATIVAQRWVILHSATLYQQHERLRAAHALRGLFNPLEREIRQTTRTEDNKVAEPQPHQPVRGALLGRVLRGHTDRVWSIAWSVDGTQCASASSDETVRVWQHATADNTTTKTATRLCEGHTAWVLAVAWSPDGTRIASASGDGSLRIWHATDATTMHILEGHTDGVYGVAWSPDSRMLASVARDGMLRVWDANTGYMQRAMLVHKRGTWSLAWSPDGTTLATGSYGGAIHLWRARDGGLLNTLNAHTNHTNSVAWSPDGTMLASASSDGTIRIWRRSDYAPLGVLRGHEHRVRGVAWRHDSIYLASAADDKTVRLWHVPTQTLVQTCTGHTSYVSAVAWAPDGMMVASSSDDATIRLWRILA